VVHLGDLFDIWRALGKATDKGKADRVASQYSDVVEKLVNGPPDGLRADILAGNHDYVLHELEEWHWPRFRILENPDARLGDVLILHGDQFDWLERLLSDDFQAGVVRLARWVSAGKHELDRDQREAVAMVNKSVLQGQADRRPTAVSAPLPDPWAHCPRCVTSSPGPWPRAPRHHFCRGARQLAWNSSATDTTSADRHRTYAFGADRGGRPRRPGTLVLLMTAAHGLGECRLDPSDPWVPSAQMGVLVGNDVRIYQVV
jgi:hypothetical protein